MTKKVLVVDDDDALRPLLALVIENAGYEVRSAVDGEEGLAAAREFAPDLLVLDIMLPRLDGFQVCEKVRALFGRERPKIVMLSAKSHPVDRKTAQRLGADLYIPKPFEHPDLLAAIRGLIGPAEK